MRFICTEFDSNINNLYKRSEIDQAVISEDGNLLTKSFRMKTTDGILYGYLSDTAREIIYSQFLNDGTFYTPSEWIAAKTTGTDYTGITQDFIFQNSSIADIVSSYFYTIISDNGVYFSLPERNSSSKEIKSYTVIDELENYETDYSFQNETGKTFILSESIKDTIVPLLIDSTLKSNRINKYKSKQNTRTIQTGSDANPLDYIQINGTYYILISKSEIKNNYYQYICVKEEKQTYSFSSADIYPYIPANIYSVPRILATTTLSATAQTIDMTGLSISKQTPFKIRLMSVHGSNTGEFYIYFNNDTTATNYRSEELYTYSNTGVAAASHNYPKIGYDNGYTDDIIINCAIDCNGLTKYISKSNQQNSTTGLDLSLIAGFHSVAQTTITQITLTGSAANIFGIGTKVIITQE